MQSSAPVATPTRVEPRLGELKRQLAEGRAGLEASYRVRPNPPALLKRQAALVDRVLRAVWAEAAMPPNLALVAVGGYGRGTLFPYSDVDVLILLPDQVNDGERERVSQLVGRLWDVGVELGHSTRTIDQCLMEAKQDITVQTNLLEARWVAGNKALFRRFDSTVHAHLDVEAFFEAKLLEQQQRHSLFNDSAYNLEPNLKEGPGGLRDLVTILWISAASGTGRSWMDLSRHAVITAEEAQRIGRDERVLQDLRIRLHYHSRRREDRLVFDLQTPLAAELGFTDSPAKRSSEQLMQRYYRTARAVTQLNEIILQNLRAIVFPAPNLQPRRLDARFEAHHELLAASDPTVFEREPRAILEVFELMQRHPELKGIEAGTLRALWRSAKRIDAQFRRDPVNKERFLGVFRYGAGLTHALRRMNRYDVLGRYLPPFGRIVGQMQHDLFHVYTVDEHILMVVRNLRRFAVTDFAHEYPLCSRLMAEFERPEVLYIAGLFHDIAKGRGGDHSTLGTVDARRFCRNHGMGEEDTELIAWLVERHLYMSSVAQKRDLADPSVIAEFARAVQTERRLAALYLLTVADIRGTSPKVWNAWKGKLLEDLFWSTRRFFGGDTDPSGSRLQARQRLALEKLRLYAVPDGAHEKLWKQLDTTYFLRHDAREIAWHARLLNYRVDTRTPVVKARLSPVGEGVQVLIYTPDQKNLFARICAFFERISFSIVEAKVYTTLHGYALDTFQVMDPSRSGGHYRDILAYIEHELAAQLERGGPLPPPVKGRVSRRVRSFPVTPEVNLRPDERGNAYYLFFSAGDRPGLLSSVARVLVDYGINVQTAKINTLGERAEDSFVITGDALRETRNIINLEADLMRVLQTQ
ncbi:MAG TPA: [protein-PII] uridylyltransferase [Burkholderiales bacterium]|nr:[protein-PII] uridylyltransferase [Burkholderiales bacterium]